MAGRIGIYPTSHTPAWRGMERAFQNRQSSVATYLGKDNRKLQQIHPFSRMRGAKPGVKAWRHRGRGTPCLLYVCLCWDALTSHLGCSPALWSYIIMLYET